MLKYFKLVNCVLHETLNLTLYFKKTTFELAYMRFYHDIIENRTYPPKRRHRKERLKSSIISRILDGAVLYFSCDYYTPSTILLSYRLPWGFFIVNAWCNMCVRFLVKIAIENAIKISVFLSTNLGYCVLYLVKKRTYIARHIFLAFSYISL